MQCLVSNNNILCCSTISLSSFPAVSSTTTLLLPLICRIIMCSMVHTFYPFFLTCRMMIRISGELHPGGRSFDPKMSVASAPIRCPLTSEWPTAHPLHLPFSRRNTSWTVHTSLKKNLFIVSKHQHSLPDNNTNIIQCTPTLTIRYHRTSRYFSKEQHCPRETDIYRQIPPNSLLNTCNFVPQYILCKTTKYNIIQWILFIIKYNKCH